MARNPLTVTLDWTRGLNEQFEPSTLPPGFAAELKNWVPELTGTLRVARGWQNTPTGGLPTSRTARGIGYAGLPIGRRVMVADKVSGTDYTIRALDADDLDTSAFATVGTVVATSTDAPVCFASGGGQVLYAAPDFPGGFVRGWDGTTDAAVSADVIAGRALIYHNNRFFSGGIPGEETTHRWSELGDPATWTTDTNFQPIGADDGEPIEAYASWDRGLFIGKRHSVWYQSGFGPDTFSWRQLDGGGCAPGRTLVATPDGVIAIGRERVWMFTGGGFEPISRSIENSYGMTGDYMTGAYIDGVVYICDNGSGTIFRLQLGETPTWSILDLEDAGEGPGEVFAQGENLYGGALEAEVNSLLLYRGEPGGQRVVTPNSGIELVATTPELNIGGAQRPTSAMHLNLRLRQHGGDETMHGLDVTLYNRNIDGDLVIVEGYPKTVKPRPQAGLFRERVGLGNPGKFGQMITLSQTLTSTESSLFDVEEATLEMEVEEAR